MNSGQPIFFDHLKTNRGYFRIAATHKGIKAIDFPPQRCQLSKSNNVPRAAKRILKTYKVYLKEYFLGIPIPDKIRIDWQQFKPFEKKVLKTLLKVKYGTTITYGELAQKACSPNGARAVGNALNRNPIPIFIPCHRVIRKDSSLGGFGGGVKWKKILLRMEHSS